MRGRWRWALAALVIVGAPFAWYVGSPLFLNKTVNEPFPTSAETTTKDFPMSAGATVPEGMTAQQVEEAMSEASKVEASASEPIPSSGTAATVVARGGFVGKDNFHRGEGSATIYRIGLRQLLRLEAFKVTNGPDLHVILTKLGAPKTHADVQQGYVEIGRLKGNIGGQNYALESSVRLEDYRAVVIYCMRFQVVFATAALRAGQ